MRTPRLVESRLPLGLSGAYPALVGRYLHDSGQIMARSGLIKLEYVSMVIGTGFRIEEIRQ